LVLGAPPDHEQVRKLFGPPLQKRGLASLGLEQRHFALGQRGGEGDPGRAAAAADVNDRAVEALDQLEPRKRVVEKDPARLSWIAERRQPGCLENCGQPALEDAVHRLSRSQPVRTRSRALPGGSVKTRGSALRRRGLTGEPWVPP